MDALRGAGKDSPRINWERQEQKDMRAVMAKAAMQAIIAAPMGRINNLQGENPSVEQIATESVRMADALIAELKKETM